MGMSKTEVNFGRLLAAAPQQQNHSKLIHYVAILRELLEQLAEARTAEGLPRVSSAVINDYSKKIEDIAPELTATLVPILRYPKSPSQETLLNRVPNQIQKSHAFFSRIKKESCFCFDCFEPLNRPTSSIKDRTHDTTEADTSAPIKLDAAAEAHIQKHRKLQEDLTDEMVGLARQLKESSLVMSQSLENTEKILDSTERAVEHSLASTGHANVRAMKIYSETSKTTCFQWLLIFVMTCIFIMVVFLIRVT
ncbi:hypothetical protein CRYUN_Cryun03dG0124600 [Craigia yunnanensis]